MMDDILEKKKEPKGTTGGVWTEDSGLPPPKEPEGVPAEKKKPKKMASGGMTASSRADGCAVKGKTRGKFV
jgi:hypothetical protein